MGTKDIFELPITMVNKSKAVPLRYAGAEGEKENPAHS
jgi:hypothetical protein